MKKFPNRSTLEILSRLLVKWPCCVVVLLLTAVRALAGEATGLPDTIAKIKSSVVAIGTFQKTRRPASVFRGTGFVIGDGLYVATNAHVVPDHLDQAKIEMIAVFAGNSKTIAVHRATKIAEDRDHDLAILRLSEPLLTAMTLGDSDRVREGETYAFTGFPIGMVLGINAVTHRGHISAITPIVIPQLSGQQLEKNTLARLIAPYEVFQLDATAYPGNSGSPLYHPSTGEVIGIINKVFVQQTKENVIQQPSGISYAIPIKHLQELLKKSGIK
ncbi:MAG: S1 family peptidase [Candidatus Binatia bacterium]